MSRLFPLVAAFAAGSTVLCGALLLLFNPRNRGIRWFTVFLANTAAWLALLAFERDLPWNGWGQLHPILVHTLPATFLAFALVQALNRPAREPLALLLIAAITAPILGPRLWDRDKIAFLWQLANWVGGAAILARNYKRYLSLARGTLGARAFGLTLVFPPLIIIGFLFLGRGFFFVGIPLMIVLAEFLTFVAVVRAQLYEIEVRAVQRGSLVADAAERERLAVVGELAASLAHEIRNPLTGVRSLLQRLTEENVDEPRRRRYASVVVEELGRVERIVSDLLGLARRSRAGQSPVTEAKLGDVVDDLILITAPRCQRNGLSLVHRVDVASQLVPREPLAQVLLNLLLNAVRHTRPGGQVTLLAVARAGAVEVRVSDQGPGIAEADRERIFEPLYSTTDGTGLGLAVVRRVAGEMGWTISIADAPGGGAEFRLQLPMATLARTPAAVPAAATA
jgi:signal transduction histidine kinase